MQLSNEDDDVLFHCSGRGYFWSALDMDRNSIVDMVASEWQRDATLDTKVSCFQRDKEIHCNKCRYIETQFPLEMIELM